MSTSLRSKGGEGEGSWRERSWEAESSYIYADFRFVFSLPSLAFALPILQHCLTAAHPIKAPARIDLQPLLTLMQMSCVRLMGAALCAAGWSSAFRGNFETGRRLWSSGRSALLPPVCSRIVSLFHAFDLFHNHSTWTLQQHLAQLFFFTRVKTRLKGINAANMKKCLKKLKIMVFRVIMKSFKIIIYQLNQIVLIFLSD